MKIEPIEIEQTNYQDIVIDVSENDMVHVWQGGEDIFIERTKIQELIDVLEHEKSK